MPAQQLAFLCLQCRQKTVEVKAKCKSCTLWWCPACLLNRYGEEVAKVNSTLLFTHHMHLYVQISCRPPTHCTNLQGCYAAGYSIHDHPSQQQGPVPRARLKCMPPSGEQDRGVGLPALQGHLQLQQLQKGESSRDPMSRKLQQAVREERGDMRCTIMPK